jgi:hypothetical protein
MKSDMNLSARLVIALLATSVSACVVTPKKVASFDTKCMVSTQKIELTTEQVQIFNDVDCITHSCKMELMGAAVSSALITTTSAIVSGSIALVGNTLYWAESQGKCPNTIQQESQPPHQEPNKIDEKYLIQEEVISVKS